MFQFKAPTATGASVPQPLPAMGGPSKQVPLKITPKPEPIAPFPPSRFPVRMQGERARNIEFDGLADVVLFLPLIVRIPERYSAPLYFFPLHSCSLDPIIYHCSTLVFLFRCVVLSL